VSLDRSTFSLIEVLSCVDNPRLDNQSAVSSDGHGSPCNQRRRRIEPEHFADLGL
jgi:hypothetical protein